MFICNVKKYYDGVTFGKKVLHCKSKTKMNYIPAPTGLEGPMRSSSMALFMLEVEKDLVGFFSPMSFGGSNLFEAAPGTQWKK